MWLWALGSGLWALNECENDLAIAGETGYDNHAVAHRQVVKARHLALLK